jgi:hypothetical protein
MVAALLALFNNDDATWPPSKTRRRFRAKNRFSSRAGAPLFAAPFPVDVGIRDTVFPPNDVGSVPNHVGTIFSFHLMWEVWP